MSTGLRSLLCGLLLCLMGGQAVQAVENNPSLVMAILAFEDQAQAQARWEPVLAEINRKLAGRLSLRLVLYDFPQLEQAVRQHDVDFVMTNPAMYIEMARAYGLTSPLLSTVLLHGDIPLQGMGGVIVTRNTADAPQTLAELEGRKVAFPGWSSLGGYLMQLKVLQDYGVKTARIDWQATGMPHEKAVLEVKAGRADAAFVRTGVLESLLQQGQLHKEEFRILNDQQLSSFPLYLSTQLYPEWPMAAMTHVRTQDAAWVTGAFLSLEGKSLEVLRESGIHDFIIPSDYGVIESLLKSLKVRPFHIEPPISLADIWRNHRVLVLLLIVFFFTVLALGVGLLVYNRKLFAALAALRFREEELRLAAVAFQTNEAIVIANANEEILDVNQAFCRISGFAREEVLGKTPRMFQSGRHDRVFYDQMWQQILQTGSWSGEVWNRKKDGTIYPLYQRISAVRDSLGRISHYVASFSDISLRKQTEEHIQRLSYHDSLTGAANRRLMVMQIQKALKNKTDSLNALLFVDLDHFKLLNDALGYDIGDELLRQVALRIEEVIQPGDTLGRLAGDDFVVLLQQLGEEQSEAVRTAQETALKIQQALSAGFELSGHPYQTTASVGISLFVRGDYQAEELLRQSEMAMYQAKDEGRYTICFFDQGMQEVATRKAWLEASLREAIQREEFILYYQPKLDCQGQLHGYEALLRWQMSNGEMISPGDFIPLAEETGLIIPIGKWVINQAVEQIKRWQSEQGKENLVLAINVSAQQFRDTSLEQDVAVALRNSGVPGHLLELEVTESMLLGDFEQARDRMMGLKELGVCFALDDFGTGYSSLNYLKKLPLSCLKIDQSFVNDMLESKDDAMIVQTIISLAKSLRLRVVAEGVETAEQQEALCEQGCDLLQGFYLGRPAPLPA